MPQLVMYGVSVGALFMVFVLFAPGGIAGLPRTAGSRPRPDRG
jgi:hypothetical protein